MSFFCPKCGSVMRVTGDGLECSCGERRGPMPIITEKVKKDKKKFGVVDEKAPLAVHDVVCPECGYGKAQIIERGIQYSDEDDYTLFKCGRCGHVEMVDAKVG